MAEETAADKKDDKKAVIHTYPLIRVRFKFAHLTEFSKLSFIKQKNSRRRRIAVVVVVVCGKSSSLPMLDFADNENFSDNNYSVLLE